MRLPHKITLFFYRNHANGNTFGISKTLRNKYTQNYLEVSNIFPRKMNNILCLKNKLFCNFVISKTSNLKGTKIPHFYTTVCVWNFSWENSGPNTKKIMCVFRNSEKNVCDHTFYDAINCSIFIIKVHRSNIFVQPNNTWQ